jgi:integrase
MKTNIVLTQDTRRAKKDGSFPLIFRLSHLGKTLPISIGISIKPTDWDDTKRQIKKSYTGVSSVTRMNNQLQKKKASIFDKINRLDDEGTLNGYSIAQLKKLIIGSETTSDFFGYSNSLISELNEAGRYGNAKIYKTVIGVIKSFHKKSQLDLREINIEFLKKFETYHLSKGNSWNSLSVYLRTVRAIYNQAISSAVIERKYYPFNTYKIRQTKTQKRAISNIDLRKIVDLKLDEEHECYHARNYFIISYFLYGLNFIDMAFLKPSNIIAGRVQFKRKKTGKEYSIKISPQLKPVLDFYIKGKNNDDFVFPIIKRVAGIDQYHDVKRARATYNKKLKIIGNLCSIETKLTSYVSRHSFATQAMIKGVPLTAISEMMGHSRLNTTQIYLKTLPNEVLDDYNEIIHKL